jgi:tRNA (cmo5U34)-methyltransferase
MSSASAAQKFDLARAGDYQAQSRIALVGYDACHELSACMLSATLGGDSPARILVVGAGGGGQEIVTASALGRNWRFTAVDPSQPMLDIAVAQLTQKGLATQTDFHLGYVDDLPRHDRFDAATLIGVLHHQPGIEAKRHLLKSIASRLEPGAPLVLAGNRYAYADQKLLLAAWGERWRLQGATADEVQARLGKILEGADPPASEDAVAELLADAGFEKPVWFFSSLFWGACLARRTSDATRGI